MNKIVMTEAEILKALKKGSDDEAITLVVENGVEAVALLPLKITSVVVGEKMWIELKNDEDIKTARKILRIAEGYLKDNM